MAKVKIDKIKLATSIATGLTLRSVLGRSSRSTSDVFKYASKSKYPDPDTRYIAVWETEDARINGEPPHHYEWRIERDTDW